MRVYSLNQTTPTTVKTMLQSTKIMIYFCLFTLTIATTVLLNFLYDKFLATLFCLFLRKECNLFKIKLGRINVNLLQCCFYVKDFKLYNENIGFVEISDILIKLNKQSIFNIRCEHVQMYLYDLERRPFVNSTRLKLLWDFIIKNSEFSACYVNICYCFEKTLDLCMTASFKRVVFVYKKTYAIEDCERLLIREIESAETFELDYFRFQVLDLRIYLTRSEFNDQQNRSFLFLSTVDLSGHFYWNFFKKQLNYTSKSTRITSGAEDEIRFESLCFLAELKSNSTFQVNIDFWNKMFFSIPILLGFFTALFANNMAVNDNQSFTIVTHLDFQCFNLNLMSAEVNLFKFHQKLAKFELVISNGINILNCKSSMCVVYSLFNNKSPLLISNKELSFYFIEISGKLEIESQLRDGQCTLTLYSLTQTMNLIELCHRKFVNSRSKFIDLQQIFTRGIKAMNVFFYSDKLSIKLPSMPHEIHLFLSSLSIRLSTPHQTAHQRIACLVLLTDLLLTLKTKKFQLLCERVVIEWLTEPLDKKLQILFSPLISTTATAHQKTVSAISNTLEQNSTREAIYISVIQIRSHILRNANEPYSSQTELIVGDIFGTLKFEDLLEFVDLINCASHYASSEQLNNQAFVSISELVFCDADFIKAKKIIYKSLVVHSSLMHVNILHQEHSDSKYIAVNVISSAIRFAYCDFHCRNGSPGYLGYATNVLVRILRSNLNEYNWLECGQCSYQHLTVYKCLTNEHNEPQVEFLIKNDQSTKRLAFLWNRASNECFRECACNGDATFFSKSFDKASFYAIENSSVIKPCVYTKHLTSDEQKLSFGQSILDKSVHAFYSYRSFRKITEENFIRVSKAAVKLSFDEDNSFITERLKKTDDSVRFDNLVLTPPIGEDFSLFIEYLPIIKNLSNARYDPQKENYCVDYRFAQVSRPPTSASLLSLEKNTTVNGEDAVAQIDPVSDTQTASSSPVSLSSVSSSISNSRTSSDITSLHSCITQVYSSSTFSLSQEAVVRRANVKQKAEQVLKLSNHSKNQKRKRPNEKLKKLSTKMQIISISSGLTKCNSMIKIRNHLNKNTNNSNEPQLNADHYQKLLPHAHFSIYQHYPILKLNMDQLTQPKNSGFVKITLKTFEYNTTEKHNPLGEPMTLRNMDSEHRNRCIDFSIKISSYFITPLAVEAFSSLISRSTGILKRKSNNKVNTLFDHAYFNILWSNHLLTLQFNSIQMYRQEIKIKDLIFHANNQHEGEKINISDAIEQFVDENQTLRSRPELKLSLERIVVNDADDIVYNLPGFTVSTEVDGSILSINVQLSEWNVKQTLPIRFAVNAASCIFNIKRYFSLKNWSIPYKMFLSVSKLNLKLKNTISAKEYCVVAFVAKSLKMRLSNSFEIEKLFLRLQTTVYVDIEVFSHGATTPIPEIRIITTGGADDENTSDVISIAYKSSSSSSAAAASSRRAMSLVITVAKCVLDASIEIFLKRVSLKDTEHLIKIIFPLVIESKFQFQSENECKLQLPAVLAYVSSNDKIQHVFEFIEMTFSLNGLERKILFKSNKSRIMNSNSLSSLIDFFNIFENENSREQLGEIFFLNYEIHFLHGELCYSYFLNSLFDKKWLYVKLYELEIDYRVTGKKLVNAACSIEYCKNAYKQQQRDAQSLLKPMSLNQNEFQSKNSIVLYVTTQYSLPEKFDFDKWLCYACIDSQHTYGYTVKLVSLLPSLDIHCALVDEWMTEVNFYQNMLIDAKLAENLWKMLNEGKNFAVNCAGVKVQNLNLIDFHSGEAITLRTNWAEENSFILNDCLIKPFNTVYEFLIDLFK